MKGIGPAARELRAQRERNKTEAVAFIRRHVRQKGYPPTTRELAEHLGYKSLQSVWKLLEDLQREGRITKVKSQPRTIQVTE